MATKTTNKTLWTVALIGAFAIAVWKLLPILAHKLNGGGSGSGGGGVGSGGGIPEYGSGEDNTPQPPGLSLGVGPSGDKNGGAFGSPGGQTIQQILNEGYANATQLGSYDSLLSSDEGGLTALDTQGLSASQYSPSTLDQAWNSLFGNSFLVTQDVPGTGIGATSADQSIYDQIQTESVDLGPIDDVGLNDYNVGSSDQVDSGGYSGDSSGYDTSYDPASGTGDDGGEFGDPGDEEDS